MEPHGFAITSLMITVAPAGGALTWPDCVTSRMGEETAGSLPGLSLDVIIHCRVMGIWGVPMNALPPGVPSDLLGPCGDGKSVCVPDEYIKTYGEFLAK